MLRGVRFERSVAVILPSRCAVYFFRNGIYAFGIYAFTVPNQIAPGGVTGLATVINAFTGIKIGTIVTVFNVPL